jgi:predicted porin
MKKRIIQAIAIGAAIGVMPFARSVAGIDVQAGDWKLDFSGNVNGFYVQTQCDDAANSAVVAGLACNGGDHSAAVRNGLLPAALVFSATTREDNLDINVTIGLYPGINSGAGGAVNAPTGLPQALGTPGIDARQAFFTFGDASWGTVKIGRDIGLFGKDAILDDMTLLGVGSSTNNAAPSNTSLGRIGIGYIYTDWEPQITYTTPSFAGFSGSLGVFQPLDSPATPGSASYTAHDQPQVQAGLSYGFGDPKSEGLSGKAWVDIVTQKEQASAADQAANGPLAQTSFTGSAVDVGVKADIAGFEGVVYVYTGKGVGTTGLYLFATGATGQKRKSDGGYVQLTYKLEKLKIGVSYGESNLYLASDERAGAFSPTGTYLGFASDALKRNSSGVIGLYYSLTKHITLVGEGIETKAQAWNGNSATEKDIALGGILFF